MVDPAPLTKTLPAEPAMELAGLTGSPVRRQDGSKSDVDLGQHPVGVPSRAEPARERVARG